MSESIFGIVTVYKTGKNGSLVVVIPKKLCETGIVKPGTRLLVKLDEEGRIIYEEVS